MRCNNFLIVAVVLLLAACGGGGGGGGSSIGVDTNAGSGSTANNVQPIAVNGGPNNNINMLLTSVRICTPGSSTQCQTIDNILVDTGSYGLRIMASALNGSATPTTVVSGSKQLVECTQFADGFTWGPVRRVDIRISGELASNVPIQIVGDPNFQTIPTDCSGTGTNSSSVSAFGANGVLGIGVFKEDCGSGCAFTANNSIYFACNSGSTSCLNTDDVTVALTSQVRNPIGDFASDNNGVIIDLPSVPDQGAATVNGSMIFGIGTQSNNSLGNARVIAVNPNSATFTTAVPNQVFTSSFIDTGSNGLFFPNGAAFPSNVLPLCNVNPAPDFFCPSSQLSYTATITAFSGGANTTVDFSVGNANQLLNANTSFLAFDNIAAQIPSSFATSFDWGLPFYFGRRVYHALENTTTSGGTGPYVAF